MDYFYWDVFLHPKRLLDVLTEHKAPTHDSMSSVAGEKRHLGDRPFRISHFWTELWPRRIHHALFFAVSLCICLHRPVFKVNCFIDEEKNLHSQHGEIK